MPDRIFIDTSFILALQDRRDQYHAHAVIEEFLTSAEAKIVHLTPERFELAFEYYKLHQDKDWGLVDCLSFIDPERNFGEVLWPFRKKNFFIPSSNTLQWSVLPKSGTNSWMG